MTSIYPDETAARVLEVALAEVGYTEKPDNLTKYGEFTKANGLPWCGHFAIGCLTRQKSKSHQWLAQLLELTK